MTPRLLTSLRTVVMYVVVCSPSVSAFAQIEVGPPETVKMRLGPVYLDPTISLSNVGVDNNVFNEATSASPKSDVTLTVTPRTDFWVRFGRTWLAGNVHEDLVYFKESVDQRSANNAYSLAWRIPLNRISFRPSIEYTSTRERPGFEIDTRALRTELDYGGQVEVKWLSKSSVMVKGIRHQVLFDQGAKFENINLHDELNRVSTSATASLQYHLTPLTTLSADYSVSRDQFRYDTLRDSKSTTLGASVRFDPAALIKGTATVGYQDYRPDDPSTPGYRGTSALVALSYVLLGSTKVNVNALRGVQYSYDINQPYYIQTGGSVSLSQQLFGPIDVTGLAGLHQLAYQNRVGAVMVDSSRVDHIKVVGGGVGYHLSRDARLGFNIEQDTRESILTLHQYTGLRYGFSVTYGGG